MPKLFRTLAFRLTLWYAGIFTVSSCVAFILFYFLVSRTILNRIDQDLLDKANGFSAVLSMKGVTGVKNLAVLEARAAGEKKIFFRLLYPNGQVFATSHMAYWKNLRVGEEAVKGLISGKKNVFETVALRPDSQRVRVLYHFSGPGVILQTGLSMETYSHFFVAFKRVFIVAMAVVVLLSALCGWFLSRKALAGVGAVTETASRISGSNLDARVPETGNQDELDYLAKTFNKMLDRIAGLVASIREMSDNIAHDLKSPITRIRGLAEITLVQGGDRQAFESMAASTIEESDRLLDMINTMLVISRADAGEGGFRFEPVDVSALVAEACDLFAPVAEDKGVGLECSVPGGAQVMADIGMLQRCLTNLMDNALKYTPARGRVWIEVDADPSDRVEIRVHDTGEGIGEEDRGRIFERFYRVDPSRSEAGAGLGLCLARVIARSHGGDVTVSSVVNGGSCFSISLPKGNLRVI
ncbi:MAG: HAMP domain-containing protein [Desulfobacteraceae bacterium]|nr:HAMP domain-containing protein [Desulfobacteraceae bacterium]